LGCVGPLLGGVGSLLKRVNHETLIDKLHQQSLTAILARLHP
jgi:hypothetical protein